MLEKLGGVRSQIRTGLHRNSLLTGKLTGNFTISRLLEAIYERKAPVPQPLLSKFPMKINRENISKNREFLSDNRECSREFMNLGKCPFLARSFFAVRMRSVLTDKFSGGGRDVVSSRSLR